MQGFNNRIFLLALAAIVGAAAFYINSKNGRVTSSTGENVPKTSTSNQEVIVTNTTSTDTITTASGLQYHVIAEGSGTESPGPDSVVSVHIVENLQMDLNLTVLTNETSLPHFLLMELFADGQKPCN